jgi:hypothetical protein
MAEYYKLATGHNLVDLIFAVSGIQPRDIVKTVVLVTKYF